MGKKVIRGGLILKGTIASGAGHDLLTINPSTGEVTKISGTPLSTTLSSANIFVGNGSNVATGVAVSGDITLSNAGVAAIATGVIVNADISASAAIALSKLATITASKAIVSDGSGFLTASATTATQIGYLSALTSDVQTQINTKQATITGAATTITSSNLTVGKALISNGSGKVAVSTISSTEIGYLLGVTSNIQTQLDSKPTVSLSSPTDGDILYQSGGVYTNLPIGAEGEVLTIVSGMPAWSTGVSNGLPSGGSANQFLLKNSGTDYDAGWQTLTLSYVSDVFASADDLNLLDGLNGTITPTELSYLAGVTSPLQTQLDAKQSRSLALNAIWVGDAGNIASQLPGGSDGQVLTSVSGVPQWQDPTPPGNVSGVAPSTDNALVRWNGTAADSIQNSGIIIDDSDNITGVATLSTGQVSVLNQATLKLFETGSTNYVGIRASGVMAADYTITLPAAAPGANTYLKYDGANYVWAAAAGGASAFTSLTDVPASYAGQALKVVRVNAGETGLEFTTAGTGTVTSVSGTANRITSTGGTTPVIDIAATYVGQTSITTLGTIGTGTWNATNISLAKGGTGVSLSDPGADRLVFWDDSGSTVDWLSIDSTLSLTATTLSVGMLGDANISDVDWTKITSTPTTYAGYGMTAAALTKTDDTNVTLTLGGSPSSSLVAATSLTLGWTGTLAAGRLNSNVVQAVTNDTNITGSIAAQNLTLAWSGTLAYSRFTNGAGLSVVGRSVNSSGVQADITGTADQVLRVNSAGTSLGFGSIPIGTVTNLQTSLDAKLDALVTTNRQTGNYTLVLGDASKMVEMNVGSANNLTVPPNSSVAFSIGTQILVSQYGAGQTTIVAGAGVTLRSRSGFLKLGAQYSGVSLVKIGTDEWYVQGDLTA